MGIDVARIVLFLAILGQNSIQSIAEPAWTIPPN
jgi:hypothetical protein